MVETQTQTTDEAHGGAAVRLWLYSSLLWLALGPLIGLLQSAQFFAPGLMEVIAPVGLAYSKLRIMHTNLVIYGWLGMAFIGGAHYLIPHLLHTRLYSESVGKGAAWVWNLALVLNIALIWAGVPGNLFLSIQPFEYAEAPLLVDILITVAVVLVIYNLHRTFLTRRVEGLYITVWYYMTALYETAIVYIVISFVNPFLFSGVGSQVVQAWWLHNIVGIFITPLGVGAIYFLIPRSSGSPLYSHRLGIVGFWALMIFYPFTGLHHFLQAPVPIWLNELAVTFSILLIIPVLAVTTNFLLTPGANWRRLFDSYPLRFALLGVIYYLATCIQGPVQASNTVNWYIHFTEWTAAHAHLALAGAFTATAMGLILHILPLVTGREYDRRMASFVFWVMALGFPLFLVAFTGSGVTAALGMNVLGQNVVQMIPAQEPWRVIRSLAGILLTAAFWGFVLLTLRQARSVEPAEEPPEPRAMDTERGMR
ncbi:MAG: Cb-type cytochrome c oxidase subunit [Dehalococcoidia bacterium]|nr:Cb-type cytochrome c oxidase subunit [Dehalococcoidia bacterium]